MFYIFYLVNPDDIKHNSLIRLMVQVNNGYRPWISLH